MKPNRLRKITMNVWWFCGHCNDSVETAIRPSAFYTVGGCQGMHEAGEYCYCPSTEVRMDVTCPICKDNADFLLEDGDD